MSFWQGDAGRDDPEGRKREEDMLRKEGELKGVVWRVLVSRDMLTYYKNIKNGLVQFF
jgi:hypothetical protein